MWLVVVPASHLIASDEAERTRIVGKIAKTFGRITNPTLVVLVLTGLYNASWYLPWIGLLLVYPGLILLAKVILVTALLVLIYLHNVYFGRRIIRLARERRFDELKALRKMSRIVSATNVTLMVIILMLAVMLQFPP